MQSPNFGGFKYLLIVSVSSIVLQQSIMVEAIVIGDCSSKEADAKLTYVEIGNCGEKDPSCRFVRGTNATIEVAFKTNAPFKQAKVDIVGNLAFLSKHFHIKPDDACGNYGFDCPVNLNEDKTLKISLPIKDYYPKGLNIQVVFKLLDESKKDIFCITFPATITD